MRFESKIFWLAKDPEDPDQFQDAFELDPQRGIAAIADGVSSSLFSGQWARILTRATVEAPPRLHEAEALRDWLAPLRAEWSAQIDASRLTWYQKPKMSDGAMSTLLWVELSPGEPESGSQEPDANEPCYRLLSFAIGDCCLFHLRGCDLRCSFPIDSAAAFSLHPSVLGSIDRKQDQPLQLHAMEDRCRPGDLLVLCTDAVALWAMNRFEARDDVRWDTYWDMPLEAWREEICELRRQNLMRYDDATLILLRVAREEAPAQELLSSGADDAQAPIAPPADPSTARDSPEDANP